MSSGRLAAIESALRSAFAPVELQVKDQSHLHAGHEGARDGRGHFDITIVSAAFDGQRPLARHRMVYDALGKLMETDIHAARIHARAPGEA